MRWFLFASILLATVYFIGGYTLVQIGFLDGKYYSEYQAIIGGLASVFGLLAFAGQRITRNDFMTAKSDLLREAADITKIIEEHEDIVNRRRKEINDLELQRREIEIIVRKVSAKVFLEDQKSRIENEIENIIEDDKKLNRLLENLDATKDNLRQLDGEIGSSKFTEELLDRFRKTHWSRRSPPSNFAELVMYAADEITRTLIRFIR